MNLQTLSKNLLAKAKKKNRRSVLKEAIGLPKIFLAYPL